MENKTLLRLHVNPRGSKNELLRWCDDVLYMKTTAPPVDGAANAAVVKLIAAKLGIRKSAVMLVSGEKCRDKVLEIEGLTIEEIKEKLEVQND